ncbi:TIGR04283 family arsenosugar biosynthesis glycosyltransferase [uncultured Desulfuromusa sp.]|uniref:TIGR04283 family arsenosugar biosynthesis glycosyltransferase n=1 Tax=uncultured Desulfuromusa sp. TaxID=219183 RepID=UPI002AA8CC59|nr:TIGR04283 family arsenosugar biosynthesis glycosyltransferase [uncultured Desulfuromusa sp.]
MPLSPPPELLIFSRYPASGKAKTRLIPLLGAEGAAQLHRRLTEHTVGVARTSRSENSRYNITVHYTGAALKDFRSWLGCDLQYKLQPSGDIGQRMQEAFRSSLEHHSSHVIGFGTDIPGLTPAILHQAYAGLDNHDIVLGPAVDGGYYLIGMNSLHSELFNDIAWGTGQVYRQTQEICHQLGLRVFELPSLSDIDLPEDLNLLRDNPHFSDVLTHTPLLSVIIPTLNEASVLGTTLNALQKSDDIEIIVADADSQDGTGDIASRHGAKLLKVTTGRADQLNQGVKNSQGRYLLFLHADTLLPPDYRALILTALDNPSTVAGAFRFKTDISSLAMRIVEWGTNVRSSILKWPYGDQGLFMERRIFDEMGGFSALPIMEDFELIRRLRHRGRIVTLNQEAMTSARRWKKLGILRTTIINQLMIAGFLMGISSKTLSRFYRKK